MDEAEAPFTVLMVCTGNICRSPAAERLAQATWGDPSEIQVRSSGTRAMVGERINLSMAHLMLVDARDTDGFAARQLAEHQVAEADLVLGMTSRHRSEVIRLVPSAIRKTFTLLEFARLAGELSHSLVSTSRPDRLRELVAHAGQGARQMTKSHDDIVDPYGRGTEVYEESYAAIKNAVARIAGALTAQDAGRR